MAGSEIDDIFAGKKGKTTVGSAVPLAKPASKPPSSKVKKEEKGKRKAVSRDEAGKESKPAKKTPVTVIDPSKAVEKASASVTRQEKKSKTGAIKLLNADDEEFRDTRGKNRPKTDDGLAIYSEAELRLDSKGGDTPLCPFDCDCCY